MPYTRKFSVPVVTGTGGDAEVYSPYLSGYVESIRYIKTDFANGADYAFSAEATGEEILTESDIDASTVRRPRAATHTTAGVAAVFATGAPVLDRVALGRDRVKIVIADGGNTKSGTFVVTMADR